MNVTSAYAQWKVYDNAPTGGFASTGPEFEITGEINMGKVEPSITFAVGVGVLQNCNVWIVDSGATTHITPHHHRIINGCDANDSEKVTMGVGESVKPNQVGDIV